MRLLPFGRTLAVSALAAAVAAQGKFVNFEDPQVDPVAIATVGSGAAAQRYVLLCNTPDDALEIWRATSPFAFVARVGVGLSPVTVRWNPATGRCYTCNHLGDSVSAVRLDAVPASGSGVASVRPVLERTVFVGDQPTDIVFVENDTQCFVSLEDRSGVAWLNLADLSPQNPLIPLIVPDAGAPGLHYAARTPRVMAMTPDRRFYALNLLGGDVDSPPVFDLGLYVADPNNPPPGANVHLHAVGDLGSANFDFAIDAAGRRMFIACQVAENDVAGVDAVAAQPTGFVQTWLKVVDLLPGAPGTAPAVAPEQTPGPGQKPLWRSVNLNRDYAQNALTALPPAQAIAQATSVVLIENGAGVQRIVLAAFGSEKVVILTPDGGHPSGYSRRQVAVPVLGTASGYSSSGPRALAYDPLGQDPLTPNLRGLIWSANRLDNSFAVINPWNGRLVAQRALANDPTPRDVREGRRFLYTAAATSGSGAVSCASCHVDARTDALVWNLGHADGPGPGIPAHFHDGDGQDLASMPDFPDQKGLMVTQTLQGLLDSHVEPYAMRFMATNAPYHWRGDKLDFPDFNEAFVRLLGMPDEPNDPAPNGLTAAQMQDYHEFVNTIHHPPNPEQPKHRVLSGTLGAPDDPSSGSGGQLGMKLFHVLKTVGPRSCVHCHQLPEGSSNTLVLTEKIDGQLGGVPQLHPFETAATRNLLRREIVVPDGFDATDLSQPGVVPVVVNGPYGLLHAGFFTFPAVNNSLSINDFVHRTFQFSTNPATNLLRAQAVTEFMRHFDTGTAPMIGLAWTVDATQPTLNNAALALLESQVREGNTGLAVYTRTLSHINALERGFWFDPRDGRYYEQGGSTWLDRQGLLQLVAGPDDAVIAQATPAGSERRVASLSGVPAVLTGPAPVAATLALLPMAPNTFFVGVASLTANWDPNHPTAPFVWNPALGDEPVSLRSIRALQGALAGSFGMPANPLRHEPPRRLRVTGDGIRPGARLAIAMATQGAGQWPAQQVWFDLVPTGYTAGGRPVWETVEELGPLHTMALLNGGYWAPGVAPVMLADYAGVPLLDPQTWNRYAVAVQNEDGTLGLAPQWQPLMLQDGR